MPSTDFCTNADGQAHDGSGCGLIPQQSTDLAEVGHVTFLAYVSQCSRNAPRLHAGSGLMVT